MDIAACREALRRLIARESGGPLAPWASLLWLRVDGDDPATTPPPLTTPRPPVLLRCRGADGDAADADATIRDYVARRGQAFFQPSPADGGGPRVDLIAPHIHSEAEVASLLRHELTHSVDALVHGWDLRVAGALACSEIRAADASSCDPMAPAVGAAATSALLLRLPWLQRRCVRDAAIASVALVFPRGVARDAVALTLGRCQASQLAADALAGLEWHVVEHPDAGTAAVAAAGGGATPPMR